MPYLLLLALLILLPSPAKGDEVYRLVESAKIIFAALPEQPVFKVDNQASKSKIALGKMLFFDTRLSKSNTISCNSCHNLALGGADNNSVSIGHGWQKGGRNSPTVLNSALHIAQFWDGRAKDVEEQAQGPILNPAEMGATEDLVLERLSSIPEYVTLFRKAFPGEAPLTYKNVANAIGAFERTLITPSRFDDFLKGDSNALTEQEKDGLALFMEKRCSICHKGMLVGGGTFMRFGIMRNPWELKDRGRIEVTGKDSDMFMFKVPSLRNVALTYPYFHNGSVWNLDQAVKIMGWVQLGKRITTAEAQSIVTFLKSLTGKPLKIELPVLPPSTASTPRPNSD